jgi:5-(aminomethyl)-3-furanmethanol phosphate kinase
MLTVVKIGGGVGADALPALCATVGELAERHPLLVVPGGAGFADAVREADRRFGLRAGTAHRMAILGMEQFGWMLSDLIPGAVRSTELRATAGRATVLLPAALPLDGLPESWDVTSDSIAAWVAGRAGAERLVLVKHASRSGVDEYLPVLLEHARFETRVVDPGHLALALP